MKLFGPQAFWPVVMVAVAVAITLFFVAIIATWQMIGTNSPVGSLSGSLGGSGSLFDSCVRNHSGVDIMYMLP